jgi:hypothetical protein
VRVPDPVGEAASAGRYTSYRQIRERDRVARERDDVERDSRVESNRVGKRVSRGRNGRRVL